MSKLVAQIASVAATASVVLVVVLVRPVDGDSPPASVSPPTSPAAHGDFHNRLQPKLDGIGSTGDLPPVALAPDSEAKRHVQKR